MELETALWWVLFGKGGGVSSRRPAVAWGRAGPGRGAAWADERRRRRGEMLVKRVRMRARRLEV